MSHLYSEAFTRLFTISSTAVMLINSVVVSVNSTYDFDVVQRHLLVNNVDGDLVRTCAADSGAKVSAGDTPAVTRR